MGWISTDEAKNRLGHLEPGRRIELLTYALRVRCSTD
jgi:hypothetical protein